MSNSHSPSTSHLSYIYAQIQNTRRAQSLRTSTNYIHRKAEAKAKKEAEKAKRAAERAATEAATKKEADIDHASENYGDLPELFKRSSPVIRLEQLNDSSVGTTIQIRGILRNSRMQGAKMAFVELAKGFESIQGVIATSPEGTPVSKQFVKWVGTVTLESTVLLEAKVVASPEPIKSCSITNFELHIVKFYVVSPAPAMLAFSMPTASTAVGSVEESPEENLVEETAKLAVAVESGKVPVATLQTLLDNPVLRMRAPIDKAIGDIRAGVKQLFRSYLVDHGFFEFEAPCLIGAASVSLSELCMLMRDN